MVWKSFRAAISSTRTARSATLAIERVYLVDDLDQTKRSVEADRLRSALLTSISHDLKTPLAAIIGAAGTLKSFPSELTDQAKAELLSTIVEESERLNRFIANLLDMTRLEAGSIKPNTARHDVSEIVGSVLERASKILAHHSVEVETASELPMLDLDPVLFEQALFNLLDNAAKYSPAGTKIRIEAWQEDNSVKLEVSDEGRGIPIEEIERIFEKFHRTNKGDQVQAGTGLGLAISRGFIEAMGGSLIAGNRSDRAGAVFTITMPIPKAAGRLDNAA
jgi:two-component system sensor histidine kinase KdpD